MMRRLHFLIFNYLKFCEKWRLSSNSSFSICKK